MFLKMLKNNLCLSKFFYNLTPFNKNFIISPYINLSINIKFLTHIYITGP